MFSKKYKFFDTIIEVLTPEKVDDNTPFTDFLCDGEPDCTVTFEYTDNLPTVTENAVTDSEVTFFAEGEKSLCWYRNHGKAGHFACRICEDSTYKVQVLREYEGKLWNGIIFNLMGFEEIAAEHNCAVLHASMVEKNGKIILFTAPCGTGKSTQASLWEKYAGAVIVNGDKALVKNDNGNIIAGGLPFSGSSDICKNISAPLVAVVCLGQAKENTIRKMSKGEAFVALMQGHYHSAMREKASQMAIDVIENICRSVAVYKLDCLPDESAVKCLEKELGL